jgi:uncharacterized repeat protein (TIGR03806 family)
MCGGGETCTTCAADCGPCGTRALTLSHVANGGGFDNVAGLTDKNLQVKVASGISPNCVEYALGGAHTLRSARLLEDNDGAWHVDTWKLEYDSGAGYRNAFDYTDTPRAMPTWNEVDFADVAGATRVKVCLQNNGPIEAAELELYGEPSQGGASCGDNSCAAGESCTSCPWDCGRCPGGVPGLDSRPTNLDCIAGSATSQPPRFLSEHPCVDFVANPPTFGQGVLPFEINQSFWSDGAVKQRLFALPQGSSFTAGPDGDLTLPPGAVTIKNFTWDGEYIETRFFVRHAEGSYGAYTYQWNDAQSEAELVDGETGAARALENGPVWTYPSRARCFDCHSEAAGFSLGLETRQLNRDRFYAASNRSANQFRTLVALGMISGGPGELAPFASLSEAQASLAARARAYLHINCSNCHRPGGPGYGLADYRFDTAFANSNTCNKPSILAAFSGMDLIEPGDHASSVVWLRSSRRGADQMPPIASSVVDLSGTTVLADWIESLSGCPTQ